MSVQTRALLKDKDQTVKNILEKGFILKGSIKLTDSYYTDLKTNPTGIDSYEKTGKDLRIRITNNEKLILDRHIDTVKGKGLPNHDICGYMVLFEGTIKDKNKALELAKKDRSPDFLIEISKERSICGLENTAINIDTYNGGINIIEIDNKINNKKDYAKTKQFQTDLLTGLGLASFDILSDNYTRQRINSYLKSDPKTRKMLLEKEIEELQKTRRSKEMISNEAYNDAGDGWHENPTYEAVVNDIMVINQRILAIKRELQEL